MCPAPRSGPFCRLATARLSLSRRSPSRRYTSSTAAAAPSRCGLRGAAHQVGAGSGSLDREQPACCCMPRYAGDGQRESAAALVCLCAPCRKSFSAADCACVRASVLWLWLSVQVRGKVNAITMDKCTRTGLLFDQGKPPAAGPRVHARALRRAAHARPSLRTRGHRLAKSPDACISSQHF